MRTGRGTPDKRGRPGAFQAVVREPAKVKLPAEIEDAQVGTVESA